VKTSELAAPDSKFKLRGIDILSTHQSVSNMHAQIRSLRRELHLLLKGQLFGLGLLRTQEDQAGFRTLHFWSA